ncbi:putative transposase [Bradyrhizobium sp. GM5.1]
MRAGGSATGGCSCCCGKRGEPSGINRIYRLYREEGLTVRKRRARRRAVGVRAPILVEARPNARWSLDFVHDQFACGRRFRILNVVDDVTRECLAAIPDSSISGRRVARELTALIEQRGKPGMIVSDNGTEFTSNAMLAWASSTSSIGTSLRRASRCRTGSAKALMAECATSFSMKPCFSALITPAAALPNGPTIITASAHIRRWAISPRRPTPPPSPQHAIGCATPTSSADRMLLHPRLVA